MTKIVVIFACILLLTAIPCSAAIITVDPNGSADYITIQAAIDDANDFDTVIVTDGTYTGNGNRDIDFLGKAITVKNANGPANCVIDCQQSGRGFYFHFGESTSSVINGFTIRNADAGSGSGGGICCFYATPTIVNCIITNNVAEYGGGIFSENGCDPPCCADGPKIGDCLISDNSAIESGGGIYCKVSSPLIRNCVISGNSSAGLGGGLGFWGYMFSGYSNAIVSNCTIIGNSAGGIYIYSSYPDVYNSIVWNNTGGSGCQIVVDGDDDVEDYDPGSVSLWYCDIEGGVNGGVCEVGAGYISMDEGNIAVEPDFAGEFEYLDPNTTPDDPNDDFWVTVQDYHLKSEVGRWDLLTQTWVQDEVTSPCIDAGMPWTIYDPNSDYSAEPWPNGHRVNMGAYGNTPEASRSCTDIDDVRLMGADWLQADSVTDIIPYPDGDGIVDLRDYAFVALHWLCQEY